MQILRISIVSLLVLFSTGCASSSNESSGPSFEDQVTEACLEVARGADQEGPDWSLRNSYWMNAATLFRNLSNQNVAFTDYAEGLNAWASGSLSSKIYPAFDFCGIPY